MDYIVKVYILVHQINKHEKVNTRPYSPHLTTYKDEKQKQCKLWNSCNLVIL